MKSEQPNESRLKSRYRRLRFGHIQTAERGEWFVGLNWRLAPRSDRHVSLYVWRLLIDVRLPGRCGRRSGDRWTRWTFGEIEITWFDKSREALGA